MVFNTYCLLVYTFQKIHLVACTDFLATFEIKKEEASYFLSVKCLEIMHLLADVEELFVKDFTRGLDGDKFLIINVLNESASPVAPNDGLQLNIFDICVEGLKEDDLGNIGLTSKTSIGEDHHLQLNYMQYLVQHASAESKLENIKREAIDLKDSPQKFEG